MAKKAISGRNNGKYRKHNKPHLIRKRARQTFEGLPIVDATKDAALVISKRDATTGKTKDPTSCAAALAGRREFKADTRVYMTRTYVKNKKGRCWVRFVTPQNIQKEIIAFDRGAKFEPGEYTLKAPTPSMKSGYYKGGDNSERARTGKKRAHRVTANVRANAHTKVTWE